MRHLKIGGVCAGAVVAIGALTTLFVSGGASGAFAGDVASAAPQSPLEVQGEVARTGLVRSIEGALGDGFGGVWFDPGSAQLHVGVSPAGSPAAAEEAAANAGLAANVTETSVRSSWAQLVSAQHRWN